jgi:general secretion pathway protein K
MRARGAALILVLWLIALLAMLVGAFALTARMESWQGQVARDGSVAREHARAGLEYALVRVADSQAQSRWLPDGRRYRWTFAGSRLQVRLVDEGGKIDINQADANLLGALLRVRGVEPEQADALAAAILDWRDADNLNQPQGGAEDQDYAAAGLGYGAKDAPFESIDELQQVLGMDGDIYARIAPFLTIYSGRNLPDSTYAPGPVLQAMGLDAEQLLAQRELPQEAGSALVGSGSGTYSIDSHATLRDGKEATLRAVIRAAGGPVPGSAYAVLRWEEGAPPP